MRRAPSAALGIALFIALGAAAVTASATLSLICALDVSRLLAGELWRAFTGHLAHLSWAQYGWDAAAFVPLFASHARAVRLTDTLRLTGLAALIVTASVVLVGMHQVYGGLSGLSCALASALAIEALRRQPRSAASYALLLGLSAYLLQPEAIASGVPVAREAHLGGALAGLLVACTPIWQLNSPDAHT